MKNSASLRKKPVRSPSEKCLHLLCWQWVSRARPDLLIFHVPNERKGGIGTALHFQRMGVLPGVADFLVFTAGRRVAIELKDEDGKQRQSQVLFQVRWEREGGTYLIVRTIEEFQGAIDGIAGR